MSKELLISSTSLETKLAILEDDQVTEIFMERSDNRRILGNIYKGKVTRVLPGMQAAFVNIGLGLVLIPRFGVMGAIYTNLATHACQTLCAVSYFWKKTSPSA